MAAERQFIGLCCGPAGDGIDAACVRVSGRGSALKFLHAQAIHRSLDRALSRSIMQLAGAAAGATEADTAKSPRNAAGPWLAALARLDRELGREFAVAAEHIVNETKTGVQSVCAIGAAGPVLACAGPDASRDSTGGTGACVEAVAPAAIAALTRLPVAAGFVAADLAAGGRGAGPQAWATWLMLRDKRMSRVAVDLGAIASVTFVPGGSSAADAMAFDAGPGTVILDSLSRLLLGAEFDADGKAASQGSVHAGLLHELLSHPHFAAPFPKTTSIDQWGDFYVERLLMMAQRHNCTDTKNLLATATEMTARSIAAAVLSLGEQPHQVVLGGGGAMNIHLAGRIRAMLSPSSTISWDRFGVPVRAKGAVCCALLAAARIDETAIELGGAGGVKQPVVAGSLVLANGGS